MQVIGVLLTILSISFACVGSDENADEESDKRETMMTPNNMTTSNEMDWTVIPFAEGLTIRWHNLADFIDNNSRQRLDFYLNNGTHDIKKNITITDFLGEHYNLTDLTNGTAYRFVNVSLEFAGDISRNVSIHWLWESNKQDNNNMGILVGMNHDKDGRADEDDEDDDNDNKSDTMDNCRLGEIGWQRNSMTDYDDDGCRDSSEDPDDDNDGVLDGTDSCPTGYKDWSNDRMNDRDGDGCRDTDEDIDDDGDGLIEIRMAKELDAMRYELNGVGYKVEATAMLNQTGCGGRRNITLCSGYELVNNISLADYIDGEGWQPIGHDTAAGDCDGEVFTAIFDGNGFVVSGLFINRSQTDCIGLFGQVNGTIRHLGVIADRIIGRDYVGGLVGLSNGAKILQSYVVSGEVNGYGNNVGGLIGWGNATKLLQSYAVTGSVNGSSNIGGLVGNGTSTEIAQSYAVSNSVNGSSNIGGLLGSGISTEIIHSYALSGLINGNSNIGGLVGSGGTATASYWDNQASGKADDNATGSSGQTGMALRSPTDYTDIYDTWDDGLIIGGIDDQSTMWCDEDLSGSIESGEMRDSNDPQGDNRVWDFGITTNYPAIRCTPGSLADQRAWWYLNSTTNKPQLDRTHLRTWLAGSPP